MAVRILPPLLALSLLSTRILPHRHLHPASYALYIDLLNRHAFSLSSNIHFPNYPKVMASIHHSLRFSQLYSSHDPHPGLVLVHLLFTLVSRLLEASLDDEGLLQHKPGWIARFPDSDVDNMLTDASPNHTKDTLHRKNTAMAIETISLFLHHKVTSRILSLVQRNMSAHWGPFVHQLQRLAANSSMLRSLKQVTPDSLLALNFNSVPGIKVTNLIEEEEGELIEEAERSPTNQRMDKQALGERRGELVISLQLLGDYEDLLTPPQSVIWGANQAAAKATLFVSGHSGYLEYTNVKL